MFLSGITVTATIRGNWLMLYTCLIEMMCIHYAWYESYIQYELQVKIFFWAFFATAFFAVASELWRSLWILFSICNFNLYHMHFISLSSYNRHKLNSLLTYFQKGFIAQSVEQCTGIVEVMVPLKPQIFFWTFFATV